MEELYLPFNLPPLLNPELDELIKAHARKETLPANVCFVQPGDPLVDTLYVYEGTVRHFMVGPNGQERTIFLLNKGWFSAEMVGGVNGGRGFGRRFSSTATPCTIYHINNEAYRKLQAHECFLNGILRSACLKIQFLQKELESCYFDSSKERLKHLLETLIDFETPPTADGWHSIHCPYTHQQLASILGTNRVTVSRLISDLCEEQYLRTLNKKMQINQRALGIK